MGAKTISAMTIHGNLITRWLGYAHQSKMTSNAVCKLHHQAKRGHNNEFSYDSNMILDDLTPYTM